MSDRPPAIELRQLHAFRIVAEELHFARAARRLGMAQPPLSQLIKRLEQSLGYRLFDRGTRKVELTPAGAALAEVTDAVMERLAAGLDRVGEIAGGRAGRLSVAFTPTTALRILPVVVGGFRARFGNVELSLSELLPEAIANGLGSGQIDVALAREPASTPGLELIPIWTEPFVAVLPSGHPAAADEAGFRLASLEKDNFILFPPGKASHTVERMLALCEEAGFAPSVGQRAPGWQTAISLVGSGLGVSILPESVVSLHLPGIVYRRIDSAIQSQCCLLCRANDDRPMVRNFVATAIEATGC